MYINGFKINVKKIPGKYPQGFVNADLEGKHLQVLVPQNRFSKSIEEHELGHVCAGHLQDKNRVSNRYLSHEIAADRFVQNRNNLFLMLIMNLNPLIPYRTMRVRDPKISRLVLSLTLLLAYHRILNEVIWRIVSIPFPFIYKVIWFLEQGRIRMDQKLTRSKENREHRLKEFFAELRKGVV